MNEKVDKPMSGPSSLEELDHLYEKLNPDERDELLQCLLIAAPRGGEAMIYVLEQTLMCHAMEELIDSPSGIDE